MKRTRAVLIACIGEMGLQRCRNSPSCEDHEVLIACIGEMGLQQAGFQGSINCLGSLNRLHWRDGAAAK